ncbi:MAG: division/cell wall cluster transcriptional repressor MraZ [Chloroflexi bacterium]|nr:division/cell wall cluster transcriptional repressor MraZ [Chloroflexota bacterium]
MFLGEYEYNIDQKGRVAIPARFRDEFRGGLVVARGYDRCIVVYPLPEWQRMADKITSLPLTRQTSRRLSRATFASAYNLELDRQGRVIIPASLRDYAGIRDSAVIVGVHNCLEIWDKDLWAAEKSIMTEQAAEIAEAAEVAL